jgi:hypothetical protein
MRRYRLIWLGIYIYIDIPILPTVQNGAFVTASIVHMILFLFPQSVYSCQRSAWKSHKTTNRHLRFAPDIWEIVAMDLTPPPGLQALLGSQPKQRTWRCMATPYSSAARCRFVHLPVGAVQIILGSTTCRVFIHDQQPHLILSHTYIVYHFPSHNRYHRF